MKLFTYLAYGYRESIHANYDLSQDCLYHHPVHKISFIAQDMSDSRAFGYIFGSPDTGHRFFGIKTDKAASQVSFPPPFPLCFEQIVSLRCIAEKKNFSRLTISEVRNDVICDESLCVSLWVTRTRVSVLRNPRIARGPPGKYPENLIRVHKTQGERGSIELISQLESYRG